MPKFTKILAMLALAVLLWPSGSDGVMAGGEFRERSYEVTKAKNAKKVIAAAPTSTSLVGGKDTGCAFTPEEAKFHVSADATRVARDFVAIAQHMELIEGRRYCVAIALTHATGSTVKGIMKRRSSHNNEVLVQPISVTLGDFPVAEFTVDWLPRLSTKYRLEFTRSGFYLGYTNNRRGKNYFSMVIEKSLVKRTKVINTNTCRLRGRLRPTYIEPASATLPFIGYYYSNGKNSGRDVCILLFPVVVKGDMMAWNVLYREAGSVRHRILIGTVANGRVVLNAPWPTGNGAYELTMKPKNGGYELHGTIKWRGRKTGEFWSPRNGLPLPVPTPAETS